MFGRKKTEKIEYDREHQLPAVKRSICTGERVGGFIDVETRQFHDYTLIKNEAELIRFCEAVGVKPEEIKEIV